MDLPFDDGYQYDPNMGGPDGSTPLPPTLPPYGSGGGYFPGDLLPLAAAAQQNADLVKWEIDVIDVIRNIEHYLRGEYYDEVKKEWVVKGNALCNEMGIRSIMSVLLPFSHKGIILSFYRESKINELLRRIDQDIIGKIFMSYQEFEIKESNWTTIRNLVTFNVLSAFNRSVGGRTTDFLSTTQKRVEQFVSSQSNQRRPGSGIAAFLGGQR